MWGSTLTGCAVVVAVTSGLSCVHSPRMESPDLTEVRPGVLGADELRQAPARQVEELLEGRVAGVQVVRSPDGGVSLRIWGPSSIYGNSEPLYVLDGVPLNVPQGQGLFWLDPSDIHRIDVLKDAAAIAMYGVRGANGVVLITTRHGERTPE